MGKSLPIHNISLLLRHPKIMSSSKLVTLFLTPNLKLHSKALSVPTTSFSTTATRYPLQYDLIISRPVRSPHSPSPYRRRPLQPQRAIPEPNSEMGIDNWVDQKLSEKNSITPIEDMDKSKRKYYRKRRKRMYGSDSDLDSNPRHEDKYVEMEQEVVDFPRLHKREEELYFYDAFAYPWEKEKHYKMVYQLEKKYFPDQCLDKAFIQPGDSKGKTSSKMGAGGEKKDKVEEDGDNGLVFFEVEKKMDKEKDKMDAGSVNDITEKKVEEFFKCLKKVPNKDDQGNSGEPYLVTRNTELPPKWDGPHGTVVLVNKPKGWTSFTVCGKLRRLVKVKKVGHAGTLDPMATGLLIVCIGKATKVVDRYQGMNKGYSGVFRLGEATSTWDADSPVIQREPWEHIKDEDIKKTSTSFCGEIWQVPPMFSAIKVGGEKMYDKARRGETVELAPRHISIFQFEIERSLTDRQNLIFRVICSKGTYIRSLCADFGKSLGSCAHLTALRRDSIGEYLADDAWDFQELEEAITKGYF